MLQNMPKHELHPLTWIGLPLLLLIVLIALSFTSPSMALAAFIDDTDGGGLVEHGTVVFLVFGIFAGVACILRYRDAFPAKILRAWLLLWIAASLYFAGEEASWGQHYFGWKCPAFCEENNKQAETNLHNASSWLNQKPRLLAETWVIFGALVLPFWRWRKGRGAYLPDDNAWAWIWPTFVCVPICTLIAILRIFEWILEIGMDEIPNSEYLCETFGSAELREYNLSIFIFIYLMSFVSRARVVAGTKHWHED